MGRHVALEVRAGSAFKYEFVTYIYEKRVLHRLQRAGVAWRSAGARPWKQSPRRRRASARTSPSFALRSARLKASSRPNRASIRAGFHALRRVRPERQANSAKYWMRWSRSDQRARRIMARISPRTGSTWSAPTSPIRKETSWSWPRKAFVKLRTSWRRKVSANSSTSAAVA